MNETVPSLVVNGGHQGWYEASIAINKKPEPSYFSIKFNQQATRDLNFQEAADFTALTIQNDFRDTKIYIGLSGGVDSEFVASVFYRNNIEFTPIICIIPGLSEHKYAFYWCKQRNIVPIVYNLLDNAELTKVAATILNKLPSYSFLHTIAVSFCTAKAFELGGVFVAGEPDLTYKLTDDFFAPISETLELIAGDLTSELCFPGKKNPGGFFFYTPELVAATAKEIDPLENYDVARSKMYNVPYRPKQQQTRDNMYSQDDLGKLINIFKLEKMSDIPPLYWTKDNLYKLLTE